MGFSVIMKYTFVIRQLAYDTSPDEYLQIGEHYARDCLNYFTICIDDLYMSEILRKPNFNAIQILYATHKRVYEFP